MPPKPTRKRKAESETASSSTEVDPDWQCSKWQSTSKAETNSNPRRSSRKAFHQPNLTSTDSIGINNLPFDCFFIVFRPFPLRTLLPLRRVSRVWNSNITELCARKKRLTLALYSGSGPYNENSKDLYFMDDLSGYVSDRTRNRHDYIEVRALRLLKNNAPITFTGLFSSVIELRILFACNYRNKEVEILQQMLHAFSTKLQLVSFSFWIVNNSTLISQPFLASLYGLFGKSITSSGFPDLKQLDLCVIYKHHQFEDKNIMIDFGGGDGSSSDCILSKLERFSLDCYTKEGSTVPLLNQLGPNLTYLSVNCELLSPFESTNFFDQLKFRSTLTHLRLNNISSPTMLQTFCEQFHQLKFVQLRTNRIRWESALNLDDKVIKPLTNLPLLTELRLYTFNIHVFPVGAPGPSLPTVKKLVLCNREFTDYFQRHYCGGIGGRFDGDLFCRTLAAQFPNLEELVILCSIWNYNNFHRGFNYQERVQFVEQQIRDHLYHFGHLPKIVLDFTAPEFDRV